MKIFNSLIDFSLKNRLVVLGVALAILLYGAYVAVRLPIDVLPDLNRPTVTLLTEAHGMAPEEVETLVTFPLETAMNGAPGVQRVRSNSGVGLSLVFVEFDWETDIYTARQLVQERLQLAAETLPEDVMPIMGPISSVMGEIMLIGVSSNNEEMSAIDLRTVADFQVGLRLQSIPGVSQVLSIGGGLKQYQVLPIPEKMASLGVTMNELIEAARLSQSNTTGGFLVGEHQEFMVRNVGRSVSLDDLAETVVKVVSGQPILIEDVAEIQFGRQVMRGDAGVNGKAAVILGIQKQPTADTLWLTEEIERSLHSIEKTLPEGVEVELLFKQATFIENAIRNVEEAIRDGAIMVALVLLLFLLNFRTTFITLTAIPLSFSITLFYFQMTGTTVNTMTLGGLAVAIGMVVDDAIVDVENVFRRLKENRLSETPRHSIQVIADASSEIRGSIFFATLIIVLVFLPLFGLSGVEGRLFAPIAEATIVSMVASFIVALTVIPALCSYLLPHMKEIKRSRDAYLVRGLKYVSRRFVLEPVLKVPGVVLGVFAVASVFVFSLYSIMGKEFLPAFNEGTAIVMLHSAPGTSLKQSNRIGELAEKLLLEIEGIKSVGRRTGRAEKDEHAEGIHTCEMDVEFHDSASDRTSILNEMRRALEQVPGSTMSIGQPISHRLDHMMSGVEAQIVVKLFGDELERLRGLAHEIKSVILSVDGAVDIQVEKQVMIPQIRIEVDREKAKLYGVQVGEVNEILEYALGGEAVAQVIDGQNIFDIFVRVNEGSRDNTESISKLLVETGEGSPVPLSLIANVRESRGPNLINRENTRRRIVISANVSGRDLSTVVQSIQNGIEENIDLPTGYFVSYEGQFQSQKEATRLILALSGMALLAMVVLLYSHFGSFNLVLQIMASIPMAFIGGILANYLLIGTISVASLVGFITLTGIAARNTIMLVSHYLHLMREEGESFSKAMIIRGTQERLIPILMTAMTAGFALMPLIWAGGEPGREILHPIAVVIVGGLFSSTILSAILTPAIFWKFGR